MISFTCQKTNKTCMLHYGYDYDWYFKGIEGNSSFDVSYFFLGLFSTSFAICTKGNSWECWKMPSKVLGKRQLLPTKPMWVILGKMLLLNFDDYYILKK